jgi:phosphate starvation-inducible membrane PsiE
MSTGTALVFVIWVLIALIVKITDFWDVVLCYLVDNYQCIRGTYRLYLFFSHEDGSTRFFQNTGNSPPYYTISHPRRS